MYFAAYELNWSFHIIFIADFDIVFTEYKHSVRAFLEKIVWCTYDKNPQKLMFSSSKDIKQ